MEGGRRGEKKKQQTNGERGLGGQQIQAGCVAIVCMGLYQSVKQRFEWYNFNMKQKRQFYKGT